MADGGFDAWIGRTAEATDVAAEAPLRRLAATLDHDGAHWPAGALPPLGHWLFHLPETPRSALAADGHPAKGDFLPPVPQPRRMWAGGRFAFVAPIPLGATLVKRTTIAAIAEKGAMTFVTLRHVIAADGAVAVEEEQDLVYLPVAPPKTPQPLALPPPEHEETAIADEASLFRFSALTFNTHRIHYDLAYARDVELYPALVVHGPLQAMLLMDAALRRGAAPARFAFRARAPLYPGRRFTLAAAGPEAWVRAADGTVTMTASFA